MKKLNVPGVVITFFIVLVITLGATAWVVTHDASSVVGSVIYAVSCLGTLATISMAPLVICVIIQSIFDPRN